MAASETVLKPAAATLPARSQPPADGEIVRDRSGSETKE
jgi:hypothetical protein